MQIGTREGYFIDLQVIHNHDRRYFDKSKLLDQFIANDDIVLVAADTGWDAGSGDCLVALIKCLEVSQVDFINRRNLFSRTIDINKDEIAGRRNEVDDDVVAGETGWNSLNY